MSNISVESVSDNGLSILQMKIILVAVCLMAAKASASSCPDLSVVQNFDVANVSAQFLV